MWGVYPESSRRLRARRRVHHVRCFRGERQAPFAPKSRYKVARSRRDLPTDILPPTATNYGNYQGNILITLLPFIEQDALFQRAMTKPFETWEADSGKVKETPIKLYQCPSDYTSINGRHPNEWGAAGYSCNLQLFGGCQPVAPARVPRYTLANIPDGPSNTVAFGEQFTVQQRYGFGGANLWASPGIDPVPYSYQWQWPPVIANNRTFGEEAFGVPQINATRDIADKRFAHTAHSAMTTLLADGSVRGVANVSPATWRNALMPDDGNVLGSDW
jgi:hypothetical protein